MPPEINIGSIIAVQIDGKTKELQVVGSADVDVAQGKISYLSPVGAALLGKSMDESFVVELETGRTIHCKILDIKQ